MRKNEAGEDVADFPFFQTAAAARSYVKCFMLQKFNIDLGDKKCFPSWSAWWKSYLKPHGKMKVSYRCPLGKQTV